MVGVALAGAPGESSSGCAVGVAGERFLALRGSTPRCGGLVVVATLGLVVARRQSRVVLAPSPAWTMSHVRGRLGAADLPG